MTRAVSEVRHGAAGTPPFPPAPVTLGDDGLVAAGHTVPLWSGSIHYWRLAPSAWPAALDEMARLGLRMVCTYVPWAEHEVAPGAYDFGDTDPRRDVARFLDLCADRGLAVILRPGPHVNAELTGFGFPERILADPACQARSSRGDPVLVPAPPQAFPAPSFASPVFREETRRWIRAFAEVVRPYLRGRGGPVVAVQADNEASFFFRTGAFDGDYAPAAVARWRKWLAARYHEDLDAVNRAYGTDWRRFDDATPPVALEGHLRRDLMPGLDWLRFKETLVSGFVGAVATMLRDAGITDVPLLHNFAMTEGLTPSDLGEMGRVVDLVGIDLYHPRSQFGLVRESLLALGGLSRLPFVPELGAGAPWYMPALSIEDGRQLLLASLAYGARAVNLYMIVDRDRWYGAPISPHGVRREPIARFYQDALEAVGRAAWHRTRRPARAAIFDNRAYGRLATLTSPWEPLPAGLFRLLGFGPEGIAGETAPGYGTSPAMIVARARAVLAEALDRTRLAWVSTTDAADPERLEALDLLCVPAAGLLSESAQGRLLARARAGATVILGPELPTEAEGGVEVTVLAGGIEGRPEAFEEPVVHRIHRCGAGRVVEVPALDTLPAAGVAALLEAVVGELDLPRDPATDAGPEVDALWHLGPDDRRFVALVNRGGAPAEAAGELTPLALTDLVTGDRIAAGDPVPLAARTVRLLEVTP